MALTDVKVSKIGAANAKKHCRDSDTPLTASNVDLTCKLAALDVDILGRTREEVRPLELSFVF